jgi:hypothetical protein
MVPDCSEHRELRGPVGLALESGAAVVTGLRVVPGAAPAREPYTGDDRELVAAIERDVVDRSLGVPWDAIAGLGEAKRCVLQCRGRCDGA